jgi:hypothetical protein
MFRKALFLLALPAIALAQTPATQENSTDSPDKVICKRFTVIGSLVGKKKVCKTKREWETDRARLREAMSPGQCAGAGGAGGGPCGG